MLARVTTFAILALAVFGCGGEPSLESAAASSSSIPTAATVPIQIVDLAGLEAALERQRGRPYLLNFWATWCPPCVAELPDLVEVAHEYRERGVDVLSVSYDLMLGGVEHAGIEDKLRRFLVGRKLDLPTLVFDGPDYDAINELLDLPGGVPVTLAFDKNGKRVDLQNGEASRARFEEMMLKALAP